MRKSVIYQEILQRGIEQVALNWLREGMAVKQIARVTGLSVERVQSLQIA